MKPPPDPHYRHRFPAEIISHAVWLYHVFSLSLRDVELLLAERGIVVSYETVRRWCKKFGQTFAHRLLRRRPRPGDKWHLDEVFVWIQGVQHYLWRAVDQDGVVLDILVQDRRDAKAAKRFFRRLLKGLQYVPRVIVTDKLRSYGVARRHLLPHVEHRQSRYLTDIFDKPFFSVGAIMIWARVTAWRRVGVGNESPSRAYDGRFLFAAPVR
jgi:putative transposase